MSGVEVKVLRNAGHKPPQKSVKYVSCPGRKKFFDFSQKNTFVMIDSIVVLWYVTDSLVRADIFENTVCLFLTDYFVSKDAIFLGGN